MKALAWNDASLLTADDPMMVEPFSQAIIESDSEYGSCAFLSVEEEGANGCAIYLSREHAADLIVWLQERLEEAS